MPKCLHTFSREELHTMLAAAGYDVRFDRRRIRRLPSQRMTALASKRIADFR